MLVTQHKLLNPIKIWLSALSPSFWDLMVCYGWGLFGPLVSNAGIVGPSSWHTEGSRDHWWVWPTKPQPMSLSKLVDKDGIVLLSVLGRLFSIHSRQKWIHAPMWSNSEFIYHWQKNRNYKKIENRLKIDKKTSKIDSKFSTSSYSRFL